MSEQPNYPVGIQSFAVIRQTNAVYVDKTDLVYKLTRQSKYVFLSRPRRFGKTLLASTLQFYFEGRKELFTGLAIDSLETEWTAYPVLRFDFSTPKGVPACDLSRALALKMHDYEELYGRNELEKTVGERLNGIIRRAFQKTGKPAVVIIDEYDAPVLEALNNDAEIELVRKVMRDFYSPLKACDDYLRFVFITGISTFSQLSIFSELNNLNIITDYDEYASICGITLQELRDNFQPGIKALAERENCTPDEAVEILRNQYDGYHFSKQMVDIFNPFSLLKAFDSGNVQDYWFQTGTPAFLLQMLSAHKTDWHFSIEDIEATKPVSLSRFNSSLERQSGPIPLLYQSGYLTIKKYIPDYDLYVLGVPNTEVRVGLLMNLLPLYSDVDPEDALDATKTISSYLRNGDPDAALHHVQALLSSIPFMRGDRDILRDAEKTEAYYHRLIFIIFKMLHRQVSAEVRSAKGAADIVVETNKYVYIIEIKLDASAEEALRQINEKNYAAPYLADGRKVTKVGVNLSCKERTITSWLTD
jgi:hypothetical protein